MWLLCIAPERCGTGHTSERHDAGGSVCLHTAKARGQGCNTVYHKPCGSRSVDADVDTMSGQEDDANDKPTEDSILPVARHERTCTTCVTRSCFFEAVEPSNAMFGFGSFYEN